VDTARSVLMVTRNDDGTRTLRVHKSNMARDEAAPVRYRITGEWPDTAVEWMTEDPSTTGGREGGPAQARVIMALRNASGPRSGQQIAATTGIPYGSVRVILSKLARRHLVTSTARGLWTVTNSHQQAETTAGQSPAAR
jgi:hypothetical protein